MGLKHLFKPSYILKTMANKTGISLAFKEHTVWWDMRRLIKYSEDK